MLRRIFIFFWALIFFVFLSLPTRALGATPVLDQYFDGNKELAPILTANFDNGQSFQPTLTRLSYLKVKLGCDISGTAHLNVRKGTSQSLTTVSKNISSFSGYKWFTFDFPDQAVIQGEEYSVWMSGGGKIYWAHGDFGGGQYPNGKSWVFGVEDSDDDFHFKTFGYTPSSGNQNTNKNQNVNKNQNKNIEAEKLIPQNLEANEVGDTWVELSWDEPEETKNIEGYIVEWGESCSELSESVDVGKETSYRLENLERDKDYCIVVSSYDKNFKTSDQSDEVKIHTLAPEEEKEPVKERTGQWWLVAGFSFLALLILGIVIYLVVRAKKRKKEEALRRKDKRKGDGEPPVSGAGPEAPTPTPTDNPQLEKPK